MLRSFFISLSTNKPFRKFSESSSLGRRVSHRFVAGMTIEEAIAAAQQLNREGIAVTLDALGESVTDEPHAIASAAIYHRLLDEIATHNLNANVSLKLTQMGMDVGRESNSPKAPLSPSASSASSSPTPPATTTSSASTWKAPSTPRPPSP